VFAPKPERPSNLFGVFGIPGNPDQENRLMRRLSIASLCLLLPFQAVVAADKPAAVSVEAPTEVMIVGTYHFSNPGADQHNVKSDDVLAPERQQQLAAISQSVLRFHPSVVAVEWPADLVDERYAKFRVGTLPPSHNEVVQLGFRLAKDAGLAVVHGIDVDGDFPYEPVQVWAQQHGAADRLTATQNKIEASVGKITALQHSGTIAAALQEMNRPENIADDYSFYAELLHYGGGDEQPGAKLLAAWHARNFEICARLVQSLHPGDHAVVFYGSGHSYLLRQCVSETPGLKLVEANEYLP
jgi:hypothetical protein